MYQALYNFVLIYVYIRKLLFSVWALPSIQLHDSVWAPQNYAMKNK